MHAHTHTCTEIYIGMHIGMAGMEICFQFSCPQGRLSNVGDMTDADAYNHSDDVLPAFSDNISCL